MDSVEYITVHDTGNSNAGSTARANGNFLLSQSTASWHYTVGNDGVFKHMQENDVAWHAEIAEITLDFKDVTLV